MVEGQTTRSCVSAEQPSRARLAATTGAGEGRRDPSHHSIPLPSFPSPSHPHTADPQPRTDGTTGKGPYFLFNFSVSSSSSSPPAPAGTVRSSGPWKRSRKGSGLCCSSCRLLLAQSLSTSTSRTILGRGDRQSQELLTEQEQGKSFRAIKGATAEEKTHSSLSSTRIAFLPLVAMIWDQNYTSSREHPDRVPHLLAQPRCHSHGNMRDLWVREAEGGCLQGK